MCDEESTIYAQLSQELIIVSSAVSACQALQVICVKDSLPSAQIEKSL